MLELDLVQKNGSYNDEEDVAAGNVIVGQAPLDLQQDPVLPIMEEDLTPLGAELEEENQAEEQLIQLKGINSTQNMKERNIKRGSLCCMS